MFVFCFGTWCCPGRCPCVIWLCSRSFPWTWGTQKGARRRHRMNFALIATVFCTGCACNLSGGVVVFALRLTKFRWRVLNNRECQASLHVSALARFCWGNGYLDVFRCGASTFFLHVYSQAKKVAEALDLLGDMVERGEKPNKNAINNVLAACARDAPVYWRHAKSVFEVSARVRQALCCPCATLILSMTLLLPFAAHAHCHTFNQVLSTWPTI